ncbi:ATP-grasp domain-containing protein [Rhizobium leguminosarum]|uniref:ATP-grasp domain-containing protein n=1 Tax=Rhizobium leguminosarum TaxID=384 RepID=UPI003F9C4319
MRPKALILVEGSRGNGRLYIKAAERLGLHPITLSADPAQYKYLAAEQSDSIRVDTNDLKALIQECSRLRSTYDVVGITGFTGLDESGTVTIGKLSQHFSLPGPDPAAIEQCSNKFIQREFLARAGVPIPAYRLASNWAEVQSAAAEIGLPVILKPTEGSGSSGVRLCRDAGELVEHTAHLLDAKHRSKFPPRILVEEFACGPFYSADTMGDAFVAVGATDFEAPPHFVPVKSIFPAPITDEERECIANISLTCLRALGLSWGPANVEFRWTKRGPVVIEVNARLPGWVTPRLIQLASGVDLVREHLKLVIGEECDVRASKSYTAGACFLVADRDGIMDRIQGERQAAGVPGVVDVRFYVDRKSSIVRKSDYRDMIGHVIATSTNSASTEAILQRAVKLISWSIKPSSIHCDVNP